MGRHKTKIEYIADERMRQLMFLKRKQAINRKLWEISVVCGVECLAVYFASNGKMFAFSSTGSLDDTMLRYCAYDEPHEVRTVADYDRFNGEDPPASEYDHMLRQPPRNSSANSINPSTPPAMAMGPLPTRGQAQYLNPIQSATATRNQQPPPQSQAFAQESLQRHQSSNSQHSRHESLTGSFSATQYQYQAHPSSEYGHSFTSPVHGPPQPTYQQHPDAANSHQDQSPHNHSHVHQHQQQNQLHQHRPPPLAPGSYSVPAPPLSAPVLPTSSGTSSSNTLWSPLGWQNSGGGSNMSMSQQRDTFPPAPNTPRTLDHSHHIHTYPPPTGTMIAGYQDGLDASPETSARPVSLQYAPPPGSSSTSDQSPPRPTLTLAHPVAASHPATLSGSSWIHSPPPTARHASEWPAAPVGGTNTAQSPPGSTPIHFDRPTTGSHGSSSSFSHHPVRQEHPSFASGSNRPPSGLKLTIPRMQSPPGTREASSGPNSAGASPSNPRKRPRTDGPDMFITPPTSGRVLPPPVVLLEPHHGASHANTGSNGATSSGHPQSSQHHYYHTHQYDGRAWPEAGGPQSAPALTGPPPSLPLPAHEVRAILGSRASDPPHPEHGASNHAE